MCNTEKQKAAVSSVECHTIFPSKKTEQNKTRQTKARRDATQNQKERMRVHVPLHLPINVPFRNSI